VIGLLLSLAGCDNGGGGGVLPPAAPSAFARFGFAVNSGDNTLSTFLIDAGSGQWRAHGYVQTGAAPAAVATDPSGKFVYVANKTDNTVSGFQLDTASGALSQIDMDGVTSGIQPAMTGGSPSAAVVDPSGKFLYVANSTDNSISGYTIDTTSGALTSMGSATPLGIVGASPKVLATDPLGKFLYVANNGTDNVSAFTINATTGALTAVAGSPFAAGTAPADIAIDNAGKYLYAANQGSDNVSAFTINATTGALTAVAGSPFSAGTGSAPVAVSANPAGTFAYVANQNGNNIAIFPIDTTSGALGSATFKATEAGQSAARVDFSGGYLYVANSTDQVVRTYRISSYSGGLSLMSAARTRTQPVALTMTQGASALIIRPKFGYVANSGDDSVGTYSVSSSTGALTSGSPALVLQPFAVAADPYGRFVYVTSDGNPGSVSAFSINTNGSLTSIGTGVPTENNPRAAVVDPSSRFLYVANQNSGGLNGSVSVFSIDANGALSGGATTSVGNEPSALAVDPTGQYLYVLNQNNPNIPNPGSVSIFSINATDGSLSGGTTAGTGVQPSAVTTDPGGRFLYVVNRDSGAFTSSIDIYAIDASTGGLGSGIGTAATGGDPVAIGADPKGRFMYVANYNDSTAASYVRSDTTGLLSAPTPVSVAVSPVAVVVDPSARFTYVVSDGSSISVFGINSTSGVLSGLSNAPTGTAPTSLALTMSVQ